jgi:general secretion pathway protein D
MLNQAARDDAASVVAAPRITLFNGQRAYVMVGTNRAFVSGYAAIPGGEGQPTRYEPQHSTVASGVLLDVAATMNADRKHATLTLRPQFAMLERVDTAPYEGPPDAPKDLKVEVPLVSTHTLQTTISVPDRQTVLLGGFARSPEAAADGAPATQPSQHVYILAKPTLIVQQR